MKKVLIWLVVFLLLPLSASADLQVYFLDVGQGDSTLVVCDGESMIIDGGPLSTSDFLYSFIRNTLKLDHMDYMISTHPHEDHVGGLAAVLNAVPVDLILTPTTEWDSKKFESMKTYAAMQGTPISIPNEGDTLHLGGATITILHCWPEARDYSGTNDMSIVVRIDYGKTSFIITGDAEMYSEYMMIDSGLPLKADVLRVAHHGSYTACSQQFIDAVDPTYTVISCGEGNSYGHPHQVVLDRLTNTKLYRTDLQGTILCVSDGTKITFSTERETQENVFIAPATIEPEQATETPRLH